MKYRIEQAVFDKYPDLRVGVVCGRGLTVKRTDEGLRELVATNGDAFLAKYNSDNLLEHPNISAWRETYRSFGVNAKRDKPTAEALLRRLINGHAFPNINTAVDAYLAVEPIHLLPIGGYDLAKIDGDITLRISPGGEAFTPLGGGLPEQTRLGEVIYSDGSSVLTRKWNFRDADHSKITEATTDIVLASEGAYATVSDVDIRGTTERIVEYESRFCGGTYKTFLLSSATREIEL